MFCNKINNKNLTNKKEKKRKMLFKNVKFRPLRLITSTKINKQIPLQKLIIKLL